MTNYEVIKANYNLPFELRPFGADVLNKYGQDHRHGYYWQPGTGKTVASAVHSLCLNLAGVTNQWIITMPPILIPNWARVLGTITSKRTGKGPRVCMYRGTPKQRRQLDLKNQDYLLMSYEMLKQDFEILYEHAANRKVGGIGDEAHKVKNHESVNFKAHREMYLGRPLLLLTGTPITRPADGYAYCKFTNPSAYRNVRAFDKAHVAERDDYKTVTQWSNLELLRDNLMVNASRILKAEHMAELPPVTYTPIFYDLEPKHYKLYQRIAEEQLVELDNGGEIDAVGSSRLQHALQQVILNWSHFAQEAGLRPAGLELLDTVLEEIDRDKLLVVANYRLSNELIRTTYPNSAALFGGMGAKAQETNLRKFIDDPECRVMVIQPEAGGYGVDGLQHVCSDILFLECPTPTQFQQAKDRLDRDGQKLPVNCRIAVANKTLQVRRHRQMLDNDELANKVQGSFKDLREAIYGG
jgi:SNF2 family DNA or RNA helicase